MSLLGKSDGNGMVFLGFIDTQGVGGNVMSGSAGVSYRQNGRPYSSEG